MRRGGGVIFCAKWSGLDDRKEVIYYRKGLWVAAVVGLYIKTNKIPLTTVTKTLLYLCKKNGAV